MTALFKKIEIPVRMCYNNRSNKKGSDNLINLPENIRAVIFDLDGTLIISSHVWGDIDRKFLSKRGLEVPEDYFKRISCMNFNEGAVYTIERFGLDERPEDIIEEWFSMARFEYEHNIKMKDGAADYLRRLKSRGIKLGLATASSPQLYIPVLKNNGVYDLFDAFASTEEVSRSKLHADVYLYTAGKLGTAVRDCAVFEDVIEGIKSASQAGFFTCACLDDYYSCDHEQMKQLADISFTRYGGDGE